MMSICYCVQVVNVWKLSDARGRGTVTLKQPLYGHTAPVLCLAVSSAFNILVSGSVDKTCIIWDLSRLRYMSQLTEHKAPVAAVSINDLTGVIATCASSWLYLWSVNGERLASVDTAGNGTGPLQINCVCMSQANPWDSNNVILTGSSDGVVRMYSLDMVRQHEPLQKADEAAEASKGQSKSLDLELTSATPSSDQVELNSAAPSGEEYADLTSESLNRPTAISSSNRPVPAVR